MDDLRIVGWDIGGAHLKSAQIDREARVLSVEQHATPLWQGLDALSANLKQVKRSLIDTPALHAVTMTGELVDYFDGRTDGVRQLLEVFFSVFSEGTTLVYAGRDGMIKASEVSSHLSSIASANWHATASYLAGKKENSVLIDMGSTTTDIIPLINGTIENRAYTDQQRMMEGELVYTGMIRTPVMAVVDKVPVKGRWQGIAAELFATMADVYRIVGELDETHDLYPAADSGEKTREGSLQRLAHMLGADYRAELEEEELVQVAEYIANEQMSRVEQAFSQVRKRVKAPAKLDLIGAGIGRQLLKKLAMKGNCNYLNISCILDEIDNRDDVADCAPAVAVAHLARQEL